jgi:hypothetical protein|uniref:Secreted protein n=1 Tax=Zea mays TaxID=4577 RepID=A0A804R7J2_MAIZE
MSSLPRPLLAFLLHATLLPPPTPVGQEPSCPLLLSLHLQQRPVEAPPWRRSFLCLSSVVLSHGALRVELGFYSSAPCSCSSSSPCARLLLHGFPSRTLQLAPSLFAAPSSDPVYFIASPSDSSSSWWPLIGSRLGRAPTPPIAGDGCRECPFLFPILAVALCSIR